MKKTTDVALNLINILKEENEMLKNIIHKLNNDVPMTDKEIEEMVKYGGK